MAIPGAIDLAGKTLAAHVRLAIPDYIGVREPSFTTAVGLIKYAYQMAELEGRDVSSSASEPRYDDEAPKQKQPKPKQKKSDDEKVSTKMKNFFGAFFE